MDRPFEHAHLSPQFCFNQTALRDFLRLSRSTVDDSINQNLNALLTPSLRGFDPSSTSTRQTVPSNRSISAQPCDDFKRRVLFPSWAVRSDILEYCSAVATAPDPDDPDQIQRQVEDTKAMERVVDERLDPYSARYFPSEARTESLAMLMRNERAVEKIIRSRTWDLIGERCGTSKDSAVQAFDTWRREQPRK
ncbi:hypothetical protein K504DRAFT_458938 [Pleomassaria siparia CBS 279.74]|uniref:Caffeine-induced death protein-like protein Cid2 n=1 Tax=Pleomassaria siparia CBS 279.74 TaxID=1314801 RepID=A0A6G1K161_9PLEO|nr:hypothetical protein K504DRAFT_458938 [Pleomassaria siparia CBS 279.74]